MARLLTCGFELQTAAGGVGAEMTGITAGVPSIGTTTPHGGAAYLNCIGESVNGVYGEWNPPPYTLTLDRTYFFRYYLRLSDATPASFISPFQVQANAVAVQRMVVNTDGTVELQEANGTRVGAVSSLVLADTVWYRVEMELRIPTAGLGTSGLWIATGDGPAAEVARSTAVDVNNSVATHKIFVGQVWGPTGPTVQIDDIAVNDDQGTVQNGMCGPGKQVLLKPTSDNAVGSGWMAPQTTGDDVTGIFASVDNTPPLGVAHSDVDGNNAKYIFNAVSDAATNYDANLQTPAAAGVGSADEIKLTQAIVNTGSSSATDTAGALALTANPNQGAEDAFAAYDNGVAGTYPTNWRTVRGAMVYGDRDKAAVPVARVGKRTATTRVAMVDLLGAYVEYASRKAPPRREPRGGHRVTPAPAGAVYL